MQPLLHIALHFAAPFGVARRFYADNWKRAFFIMMATMVGDLDHLLAVPVYAPQRCSIGFRPLHSSWAIGIYVLLLMGRPTRLLGIGLLVHMELDGVDCAWIALE